MRILRYSAFFVLAISMGLAQQAPEQKAEDSQASEQRSGEQKAAAPEVKKYLSPTQRMVAAKTVYMKNGGGSDIPFDVIQSAMEAWPKYMLVDSPEKADLIIEVVAPKEDSGGTQVSTKVSTDAQGKQQTSSSTSKDFSVQMIKMTVLDARTKVALWSGIEHPKNAWKERARQDSQVECARKLVTAFHDRVEPQAAPEEGSPK